MKRQPIKWKKLFSDHVSDKGLIFKIFKELNIKKTTNGQLIQFKKRQSTWRDIVPKNIYKWPTGT